MIRIQHYRTSLIDRIAGDPQELGVLLCDMFLVCRGKCYIWVEKNKRWNRVGREYMVRQIKKIISRYIENHSKKEYPNIGEVIKRLTNDNIKFMRADKTNIIYDDEYGTYRNITREDYVIEDDIF